MNNFQKKYELLSIEEKNILFVLAILFTKCEQTTLYQLLTESKLCNSRQQPMSFRDISSALQSLKKKLLISHENQCNEDIRERVMMYASKNVAFANMLNIIKKINENYNIHCFPEDTILSDIRIAIYTNNEKFLYLSLEEYKYLSWHNTIFVEILLLNGGWEKCKQHLSKDIFLFLLLQMIEYNTLHLLEIPSEALQIFENEIEHQKKLVCNKLCLLYILQGNFSAIQKLPLALTEAYLALVAHNYVRREFSQCKTHCVQALKQIRAKKMCINSGLGIFLALYLLQNNNKKQVKFLAKMLNVNSSFDSGYQHCYEAFQALSLWLENNKNDAKDILMQLHKKDLTPFNQCILCLCTFWIDKSIINASHLQTLQKKAMNAGFFWLHEQLSQIASHLENIPQTTLQWASYSLIEQQQTPWKNTLKSLFEIANSIEISEKRLAWFVSPGSNFCKITLREQKKKKGNIWNEGRLLEINSELEEEYFSTQDKKIIVAYLENQHRYEYGHWKKVLIEMANHPCVFHEEYQYQVNIIKKQPELSMSKKNKEIRLSFLENYNPESINYIKESDSKISLVKFDKAHLDIANILKDKGHSFPVEVEKELNKLCSLFSKCTTVHSYGEICSDKMEVDERVYVRLTPWEHGFRIDVVVKPMGNKGPALKPGVGGKIVVAHIAGTQFQVTRNLKQEITLVENIFSYCPLLQEEEYSNWEWTINDVEKCLHILLDLRKIHYVKIEWPQGKKLKIQQQISWNDLQIKISKKKDWFELDGSVELNNLQVIKMQNLLIHIENSPDNYIALNDNEFILLTSELRKKLEELRGITDHSQENMRIHPLASEVLNNHLEGINNLQTPDSWCSQIKKLKNIQDEKFCIPANINATLRSYQEEGFFWLAKLDKWGVGACLADDMGLGKTLQALTFILHKSQNGPSLVIAPTSVTMNWEEEAAKFTPDLRVKMFTSSSKNEILEKATSKDLVVASYGILQNRPKAFTSIQWQTIVLDEAQAIKNSNTQRSQIAMLLEAKFKLITTGTPIENHLGELWNLFQFINPGLLGTQESFRRKYMIPIEKDDESSKKEALRKLVQPFILRRLKKDVLKELPPRIENTLYIETNEDEKHFYEALRQKAVAHINAINDNKKHFKILAEIMKLRRACCHPILVDRNTNIKGSKLEAFANLLAEIIDNNHRVLIFSQFVQHLTIIREHLEKNKIIYQYLDGSTPQKERKKRVKDFQSGIGSVFLISLKAGGLGLNLTGADYVIQMDPWWNPAVEDQAADRAHRLGQTKPVNIYRLVTKGTIEEKIVQLHKQKKQLAQSILTDTNNVGKINIEELLDLIKQ